MKANENRKADEAMRKRFLASMLRASAAVVVALGFFCSGSALAHSRTIHVPAGSSDVLADAIAAAGPGGRVVLERGLHTESGTVFVEIPVSIVGENGAILESTTSTTSVLPIPIEAALHIRNASGTRVQGLSIRPPAGTTGGCGIVIEDSSNVRLLDNQIVEHNVGILIQRGDRARIHGNNIQATTRWMLDSSDPEFLPLVLGIAVANGRMVSIKENSVTNAFMGIFLSDQRGQASHNVLESNFVGMILCKLGAAYQVSGEVALALSSANQWFVHHNHAANNEWGYLVIDGANQNILAHNSADQNSAYDVELAGDSTRFGFLAPASYENVLEGRSQALVVKDCGINNDVRGNVSLVDTGTDSCF